MRGLNHCEGLQRQYGYKLEQDLNHIQSERKSVTPDNLFAGSNKAAVLTLNTDPLRIFTDDKSEAFWYDKIKVLRWHSVSACRSSVPMRNHRFCVTVSTTFSWSWRHNDLFESAFYILISPFSQICPFLYLAKIRPPNGNTMPHKHTLASKPLHLHN